MLELVLLSLLCSSVVVILADNTTEYHARADAGLQSYLLKFWNQNGNYIFYAGVLTQYWTFAQGFDAVLDGVERTQCQQYLITLQYYSQLNNSLPKYLTKEIYYGWMNAFYTAQTKPGFYRTWYDDENWMALALVRAYDLASSQSDSSSAAIFLKQAVILLEDIANGWDTTCCGSMKGGIWWDKTHSQKATASNAGPVILASRLYHRTGNSQYLQWAEQWFNFWSANMVSSSYEVADHFDTQGNKVWWKFTYNSGLMVGAATELYKVTNNSQYPTRF